MRTSYNIYNSKEFIGFCIITKEFNDRQVNLVLFEGISPEYNHDPDKMPGYTKNYPLDTSDIDIVRDIVSIAKPSVKTDGLTYKAKKEGETFKL